RDSDTRECPGRTIRPPPGRPPISPQPLPRAARPTRRAASRFGLPQHDIGEAEVLARRDLHGALERVEPVARDAHPLLPGSDRYPHAWGVTDRLVVHEDLAPGRRVDEQPTGR